MEKRGLFKGTLGPAEKEKDGWRTQVDGRLKKSRGSPRTEPGDVHGRGCDFNTSGLPGRKGKKNSFIT